MEETLLQSMDTAGGINSADLEDGCSFYGLRTRTVIKEPRRSLLHTQTFGSDISKSPRLENYSVNSVSEKRWEVNRSCFLADEDADIEDSSQESVSMLQELYQSKAVNEFPELIETCIDPELDVISIYTDDEAEEPIEGKADENEFAQKIENSTQTDFSVPLIELTHPKDLEIKKHANFIISVVKLKALLSSKEPNSDSKILSILYNTMSAGKMNSEECSQALGIEGDANCQTVPKETIGYLIRSTNVENVFYETVETLLLHLKSIFSENVLQTSSSWKNSVYEMAVAMLSEAVDYEVGIWKMVDLFLCREIRSVVKDGGRSKNLVLESKANFIIHFGQSTHLSYTAINFVIKKLEKLKKIKLNSGSLTEKVSWAYLIKNSFFLLRILESLLEILKDKIAKGKVEDVFRKKPEQKNYNVLEMWRKHWSSTEVFNVHKTEHDLEMAVNQWCTNLDEILLHCINDIPVLSMAVKRCEMLAKDILKMCHSEMMMDKKTTSLDH